jgi:hypothetical protein
MRIVSVVTEIINTSTHSATRSVRRFINHFPLCVRTVSSIPRPNTPLPTAQPTL